MAAGMAPLGCRRLRSPGPVIELEIKIPESTACDGRGFWHPEGSPAVPSPFGARTFVGTFVENGGGTALTGMLFLFDGTWGEGWPGLESWG